MIVIAHPNPIDVSTADRAVVQLFGAGARDQVGGVGRAVMLATSRWRRRPSAGAWDFLAFALAVEAADRLVLRSRGEDGWTRTIDLTTAVVDPDRMSAHAERLAAALGFLSGDRWTFRFVEGGLRIPRSMKGRRREAVEPACKTVCLFSGGADSLAGAWQSLADRPTVLVSHAPRGDAMYQRRLHARLPSRPAWFSAHANATTPYEHRENSQRSRSLLFLALAAMAASTLPAHQHGRQVKLLVPENGFMAINAPLTARRIGSLSTRTTHPHFLRSINAIWAELGLGVSIENPLSHLTKGEVLAACEAPDAAELFSETMSCGKWLRLNKHCGTCVPCLVRRAAFLHAGMQDATDYNCTNLATSKSDDVHAVRWALEQPKPRRRAAVLASGPIPNTEEAFAIHDRGLAELRALLR